MKSFIIAIMAASVQAKSRGLECLLSEYECDAGFSCGTPVAAGSNGPTIGICV
jgi:hypothetical protein